jgi:hypothetical protein
MQQREGKNSQQPAAEVKLETKWPLVIDHGHGSSPVIACDNCDITAYNHRLKLKTSVGIVLVLLSKKKHGEATWQLCRWSWRARIITCTAASPPTARTECSSPMASNFIRFDLHSTFKRSWSRDSMFLKVPEKNLKEHSWVRKPRAKGPMSHSINHKT